MMATADKKAKATPAPKKETVAKEAVAKESVAKEAPAAAADKSTPAAEPAKAEVSEKADAAPKSYSRGEGQKPVTQEYKDNWNAIFGSKEKTKKKTTKKAVKKATKKASKKKAVKRRNKR